MLQHRVFRVMWWSSNVLLATSIVAMLCAFVWEYFVRSYLEGFSDAIVPNTLPAEQKVKAIRAGAAFFSAPEIEQ
jgi:uncharacterized membrane protein